MHRHCVTECIHRCRRWCQHTQTTPGASAHILHSHSKNIHKRIARTCLYIHEHRTLTPRERKHLPNNSLYIFIIERRIVFAASCKFYFLSENGRKHDFLLVVMWECMKLQAQGQIMTQFCIQLLEYGGRATWHCALYDNYTRTAFPSESNWSAHGHIWHFFDCFLADIRISRSYIFLLRRIIMHSWWSSHI